MNRNFIIYISTFSNKIYHKKNYELPIEVGAANSREFVFEVKDNTGDNISSENCYYGELTALYWIWKNTYSEYVGLYHYNKSLKISPSRAIKLLNSGYDVIVPCQDRCYNHKKSEQYILFVEVLRNYDSEFYKFYLENYGTFGAGIGFLTNMLIAKRDFLNEYCEFLFPLMKKVREVIGDVDDDIYYKRYCAFFAERLMKPYVEYKRAKAYQCKVKARASFKHIIFCKWYGINKKILPKKLATRLEKKFKSKLRISSYK